jgi:hypothetical protein
MTPEQLELLVEYIDERIYEVANDPTCGTGHRASKAILARLRGLWDVPPPLRTAVFECGCTIRGEAIIATRCPFHFKPIATVKSSG